jgi:hypothetical protein
MYYCSFENERFANYVFYDRIVALNTRQAELMLLKEDPELWNRIKFWIADIDRSGNITPRMQKCDLQIEPNIETESTKFFNQVYSTVPQVMFILQQPCFLAKR